MKSSFDHILFEKRKSVQSVQNLRTFTILKVCCVEELAPEADWQSVDQDLDCFWSSPILL